MSGWEHPPVDLARMQVLFLGDAVALCDAWLTCRVSGIIPRERLCQLHSYQQR